MFDLLFVRNCLFTGGLMIAAANGSAIAADIPLKAPAPAAVAYRWSGLYVGAVAAGGWGHSEHCDPLAPCAAGSAIFNMSGWLGGATIGYNWQFASLVAGAEADWSFGKIKGSMPSNAVFSCGTGGTCDTKINSMASVRGRLGFAVERFLPYVTAGVAFTRVEASDGNGSTNFLISDTQTQTKFVWGGGLEYAFDPRWSLKVEYLRVGNLSDFTYGHVPGICACFMTNTHYETVRLGVNYLFDLR